VDALGAVLEGEPERLMIEPTGLARTQDLVDTIRRSRHSERLQLGPVVMIADPRRILADSDQGREILQAQVEAADVIVANRIDLCSQEELERFDAWAAQLWPAPLAVQHAVQGRVPTALFDWPEGEGRARSLGAPASDDHGEAHSTAGFSARSWGWAPDRIFASDHLRSTLAELARRKGGARLERFKGIFRTREGVFRYEVAGGELHEQPSAHRRDSRADAIFSGDAASALEETGRLLEAAVLSEQELAASSTQIELALPGGRVHLVDREQLEALPDGIADVARLFPKRSGSAARVGRLFASLGIGLDGSAVVVAGDGFASEPVSREALAKGVLLHSYAGAALPAEQGGPFRLLIPAEVPDAPSSCANVKGVARIVLRD
jgi:G3E family GTPase